jgi:hypothetical protein
MHPHTTFRLITLMQHGASLRDLSLVSSADETGRGKSVQITGARMSGRGPRQCCIYIFPYFSVVPLSVGGRDSSVGIATRYGLDGPRIESRWGARFTASVQTGPGAHPASYASGTGSLSRGVKRPGCGVDHPSQLAPRLNKE